MDRNHVISLLALGLVACSPSSTEQGGAETVAAVEAAATAAPDPAAATERGRYLVAVGSCIDCHTPFVLGPGGPEPDMTRLMSGHPEDLVLPEPPALPEGPWMWVGAATNTAFAGPWGVSYAPNLTPDASGMAAWDVEIFRQAMRTGQHYGVARPILPPMPWPALAQMTDEDLEAVFAYLQSLPPIVNHAPDSLPAPPPPTAGM